MCADCKAKYPVKVMPIDFNTPMSCKPAPLYFTLYVSNCA
jgi:hypothetical protein